LETRRISGVLLAILAIISFVAAGFSLLWAFSSYNLAFADCHGNFSLAAENFRCQRPIWLSYAFWAFIVLGFVFTLSAIVLKRRVGANP